jgi:hemoglobin
MQLADPVAEIYPKIGSDEPYYRLVEAFYSGVETDVELRPIYPPDLGPGKKHLTMFLVQRTGGPQTYSEQRGHPRMRARHLPFKIGLKERDSWIRHMTQALDTVPEFAPHKAVLMEFFENFATFIINQPTS